MLVQEQEFDVTAVGGTAQASLTFFNNMVYQVIINPSDENSVYDVVTINHLGIESVLKENNVGTYDEVLERPYRDNATIVMRNCDPINESFHGYVGTVEKA